MQHLILMLVLVFAIALPACSGNSAQELFEAAKFEEVQSNKAHARELYEEIVKKYPNTEYAKKAEGRLSILKKDEIGH
jgi:TolA-binding protein